MEKLTEQINISNYEAEKADKIFAEFEKKLKNEKSGITNPLWEELKNEKLAAFEEKYKKRKDSDVGESINLYYSAKNALKENIKQDKQNVLDTESISIELEKNSDVDEFPLGMPEDFNQEYVGSSTDDLEKAETISQLKKFKLQFNDIPTKINYDQKYYFIYIKNKEGEFVQKRISNFVILPLSSIKSEDGNQKLYARLINHDTSEDVVFDGEKLANLNKFKTFVRSYGNFNWNSNQEQLNYLNDLLGSYKIYNLVEKTYAGWHENEKIWLFPDRAYFNGKVYPSTNGNIAINGKSFTFASEVKPKLKIIRDHTELPKNKKIIIETIKTFIDLYKKEGYIGIGWIIASFVANVISKKELAGQFPIAAPYGIYESGKTGFSRFLSELAGIDIPLRTEISKDQWRKDVHAFSCLPVMYDEFKEQKGQESPFKLLRSYINKTFDRSVFEKGNLSKYGTDQYKVNATVALIGEVPTTDSAILSRFIHINSNNFELNITLFRDLQKNLSVLNAIGQYFMRTSEDWKISFIKSYYYFLNKMAERAINSNRLEVSYSIVLAGVKTFMEVIDNLIGECVLYSEATIDELFEFAVTKIKKNGQELKQSHPSFQFLEDIGTMAGEDDIKLTAYNIYNNINYKGKVYEKLLFLAPRSIWNSYKSKVRDSFYTSNIQVKKDLETYPFFLGSLSKRISNKLKSAPTCWVIDLTHPLLPPEMQNFDSIISSKNQINV